MSKIGARLNYTIPLTKLAYFIVWSHEAVVKKELAQLFLPD